MTLVKCAGCHETRASGWINADGLCSECRSAGLRTRRHIGTHTFYDRNGKRVRLAVYVNGEALARALATRAMGSRNNRASYGDGAVLVEVVTDGK